MAIYTKTGDRGKTSTFSGKRISKSSKLISAIGAVDELNSYLGIIGGFVEVQRNLFTINSILSGAKMEFPRDATKKLENQIDVWEGKLPVLKNFLIYSGTSKATQIYFARALCRRAERSLVVLSEIQDSSPQILVYVNRLSDFLFMQARLVNYRKRVKEFIWKPS